MIASLASSTHRPAARGSLRHASQAPRQAGLSLVEMMVALAISAMLLTATMAATDACFKAYASAAAQASSQAGSRMVSHRLLTLIRTSTAHGPLTAGQGSPASTISGNIITSSFIELRDTSNKLVRIEHRADTKELWMIRSNLDGTNAVSQPLLGGVSSATFTCVRRKNNLGQWTLERGTVNLTVEPGSDATAAPDVAEASPLAIERGSLVPIRIVASTAPRQLLNQ